MAVKGVFEGVEDKTGELHTCIPSKEVSESIIKAVSFKRFIFQMEDESKKLSTNLLTVISVTKGEGNQNSTTKEVSKEVYDPDMKEENN